MYLFRQGLKAQEASNFLSSHFHLPCLGITGVNHVANQKVSCSDSNRVGSLISAATSGPSETNSAFLVLACSHISVWLSSLLNHGGPPACLLMLRFSGTCPRLTMSLQLSKTETDPTIVPHHSFPESQVQSQAPTWHKERSKDKSTLNKLWISGLFQMFLGRVRVSVLT